MKIFTQTYDLAKASPHRFWVAPFSEFKIGIKILEKDEISSKDFTLKAGSIEFTPDEDKIDNFTLYTIKSNDTGFVDYTIEVEGVAEKLKLMQIVTDSTVFEIDAGGGDVPADVATQTWVNSQISDFITEDALDGYATESYVDSATSSFVEEGELTAYATKAELTAYAETSDLTAYAEKTDLTAYYTKSETSSATEIQTAFNALPDPGIVFNEYTTVKYNDGTLSTYNLVGQVTSSSSSNFTNATDIIFGTKVTSIGSDVCNGKTTLKTVAIPSSVSSIGNQAFAYCSNLSSVAFSEGLQEVRYKAFVNGALAEINLPNTLTSIGQEAFKGSSSGPYIGVDVPMSVTSIGVDAFATKIWTPNTLNFIGKTLSEVQAMTNYPFGVSNTAWITAELTPTQNWVLNQNYVTNLSSVSGIMKISQADYDVLSAGGTADANTLYVIV